MVPADIHLHISPLTPRSCSSPGCQNLHSTQDLWTFKQQKKNMSKCPEILQCLPQILVQMKRTMSCSVRGGGTHPAWLSPGKGWSQTPWEHESTPPCPTHGCQDRLNHFLGVSASLCWLEETFRWLSAARVPCEWLNSLSQLCAICSKGCD